MIDRVPEELWTEVHNVVQEVLTKGIPKRKKEEKLKAKEKRKVIPI